MSVETGQFGFPLVCVGDLVGRQYDCLVLGIPFDLHTVTQPGARYGPQFLAETCSPLDWHRDDGLLTGLFSHEKRKLLFHKRSLGDLGDLELTQLKFSAIPEFLADLELWAALLANHARIPLFIGGDHSLTLPILTGLKSVRAIETLLVLDAHSDFDPFLHDTRSPLLHNNFTSHVLAVHADLEIIQIGVRDYSLPATRAGKRLTQLGSISPNDLASRLMTLRPARSRAHLSIDVDVLDPAFFAHVSAPLANGYSFHDVQRIVDILLEHFSIESIDVMEICPDRSRPAQQAMWMNYCVLEILSSALDAKRD